MDEQLAQLLDAVSQTQPKSSERQKTFDRLLLVLMRLPGLYRSSHQFYGEALNKTWLWASENIDSFSLDRSRLKDISLQKALTNWINGYLKFRVTDLSSSSPNSPVSLDAQINNDEEGATFLDQLAQSDQNIPTLSELDAMIEREQQQNQQVKLTQLIQWIREDPEGILRKEYPKKYPNCNGQVLTQLLYLDTPPKKMADVSRYFNINYHTLVSFHKRNVLPLLRQKAIDLGCSPEDKQ